MCQWGGASLCSLWLLLRTQAATPQTLLVLCRPVPAQPRVLGGREGAIVRRPLYGVPAPREVIECQIYFKW